MRIESISNERVKAVRKLHRGRERRRSGRILVEGPKLVEAAVAAELIPETVYASERSDVVALCEAAGAEVIDVTDGVVRALSTTVEPQSPVAVIVKPPNRELEGRDTIVAVDLADPGNLGTLIRTAAALGWQVAIIGGVDPWSPKALRASAGTQFSQPAIAVSDIGDLVAADLSPWATVVAGGGTLDDLALPGPLAVLIGSEAHGLDSSVARACRGSLTIPMAANTESLNAAVAGAIVMHALGGRRGYGKFLS